MMRWTIQLYCGKDVGHLEAVSVCQFVSSLFRGLALVELGFMFMLDEEIAEEEEYID